MIKKDNETDRLSERINADLRAKMDESTKNVKDADLAEDSDYVKDLKKTSKFGWVWVVLIILAIFSMIAIFI